MIDVHINLKVLNHTIQTQSENMKMFNNFTQHIGVSCLKIKITIYNFYKLNKIKIKIVKCIL